MTERKCATCKQVLPLEMFGEKHNRGDYKCCTRCIARVAVNRLRAENLKKNGCKKCGNLPCERGLDGGICASCWLEKYEDPSNPYEVRNIFDVMNMPVNGDNNILTIPKRSGK